MTTHILFWTVEQTADFDQCSPPPNTQIVHCVIGVDRSLILIYVEFDS